MEARTKKIILIVSICVFVAGAISVGLYFLLRDKDNKGDEKDNPEDNTNSNTSNSNTSGNSNTVTNDPPLIDPNVVNPRFNEEGELENPMVELQGRMLYPKRKYLGGWDYTNVRLTTEVNTDRGWWDFSDNLLATINAGTPIGTVVSEQAADYNGHAYRWFKVKLYKSVWTFTGGTLEYGFVRADTVTIKSYNR